MLRERDTRTKCYCGTWLVEGEKCSNNCKELIDNFTEENMDIKNDLIITFSFKKYEWKSLNIDDLWDYVENQIPVSYGNSFSARDIVGQLIGISRETEEVTIRF